MRTLVPAVLLALVFSTGCRRIAEKIEEKAIDKAISQTGAQVHLGDGGLTLTGDGGVIALGANAKVPDDFPKTVPIYPGAQIEMAIKEDQKGKEAWSMTMVTSDDNAKVATFYKANLSTFRQKSEMNLPNARMVAWENPQYAVSLMTSAGASQGKTTVQLSVAKR